MIHMFIELWVSHMNHYGWMIIIHPDRIVCCEPQSTCSFLPDNDSPDSSVEPAKWILTGHIFFLEMLLSPKWDVLTNFIEVYRGEQTWGATNEFCALGVINPIHSVAESFRGLGNQSMQQWINAAVEYHVQAMNVISFALLQSSLQSCLPTMMDL